MTTPADNQASLFAPQRPATPTTGRTAPARAHDPLTSHQAAKAPFQRESQRHLLLREYARAADDGTVRGSNAPVATSRRVLDGYTLDATGRQQTRTRQADVTPPAPGQKADGGLTDEEAAEAAGITRGCPWKRCSELRESLLITVVLGATRTSSMGATQQVCAITPKGRLVLSEVEDGVTGATV